MNSYDFENRVAIVTGGGQGIGHTVAKRILESGGTVSIWDVDQALLDDLGDSLGLGVGLVDSGLFCFAEGIE